MKSFDYAKEKNKRHKKWWRITYKEYDIHLIALPIAPFVIIYDKLHQRRCNRLSWDSAKACKVLDHFLPYVLEYAAIDNAYYYCVNWRCMGSKLVKYAPLGLKMWAKKFSYETLRYLKTDYQKAGFVKVYPVDDEWIRFTKNI